MKTTHSRNGKIARLPRPIRDELNQRLENGQSASDILPWLNSQPEVCAVLAARFHASPIGEQNLANWRHGGHQDWLQQQERRGLVLELAENGAELAAAANGQEPANHLSLILVAELALAANELQATVADPADRCERLQKLLLTLAKVRQQDYLAGRLAIERERRARERMKEEDDDNYRKELATDPINIRLQLREYGELSSTPTMEAQRLALQKAEAMLRSYEPRVVQATSLSRPATRRTEREDASIAQSSSVQADTAKSASDKPKRRSPLQRSTRPASKRRAGVSQRRAGVSPAQRSSRQSAAAAEARQRSRSAEHRLGPAPIPNPPPISAEKPASSTPSPGQSESSPLCLSVSVVPSVTPPANQAKSSPLKVNQGQPQVGTHTQQPQPPISPMSPMSPISPIDFPTPATPPPTPTPPLDPAQEAYNHWYRMNNGFEPFDHDLLEKLYAAIPKQDAAAPTSLEQSEGEPNKPEPTSNEGN